MSVHMLFSGCVYVSVKMYVSILMSAQIYFLVTSAEMCLYVLCLRKKRFHNKDHSLKSKQVNHVCTSFLKLLLVPSAGTGIIKEVPSRIRATLSCGTICLV